MKHCKYCNVDVSTSEKYCPLCYNILEGEEEKSVDFYQKRQTDDKTHKTHYLVSKIFFMITLAIVATCVFINILTWDGIIWSLLVGVSVAYVWIFVAHTILSKRSIFEKVLLQLVGIIAIVVVCNILSKGNWLLNYVLPSIELATAVTLAFVTFILRNKYKVILPFFLVYILLLVTSIVLLAIKADTFMLLSEINIIMCGLAIVGTLIFGHKTLKTELAKKFHL